MNWKNVDLTRPAESSQNILDPYSFDTLLLEVECNCPVIDRETVRKQALAEIELKYQVALQILEDNLDNITNEATKVRATA